MTVVTAYHAGELAAQDRAGTRGVAAELFAGKSSSLNFASNHDAFLAAQSFAVVSSVDVDDRIWVTPLFGKSGDLSAASESDILISASSIPKNDVLHSAKPGTPLSLLGIDLMNRKRHRISGIAGNNNVDGQLHLRVTEYSPNCPKYINRRELIIPGGEKPIIDETAVRQERTELYVEESTDLEDT
jgi:predicted pyridoxine 5'-phosphate oxidase superfamily flavin-nucleotide-binding protein